MTESTDPERSSSEEVSTRVSDNDVGVEKIARRHREDSVAVALKLKSRRADRCEVRLRDPLPEAVRDSIVEFHPDYDATDWTISDQAIVYAGELEPEAERMMVYGVLIDDPGLLERFSVDPSIEVSEFEDIFEYWSGDGTEPPSEPADGVGTSPGDDSIADPATDGAAPAPSVSTDRTGNGRERSVIEALVSEVGRRDLSTIEKRALRQALDLDGVTELERELGSLREEIVALREAIETLDQRTTGLDQLEAGVDSLSDTVERLQAEVERGAHWRSVVHEAIVYEPDGA